jgi:hypothetical protein
MEFLLGVSIGLSVPYAVDYVDQHKTSLVLTAVMLYDRVVSVCKRRRKSRTIIIGDYTVHGAHEYQFPTNGDRAWKDVRNPRVLPRKNSESRIYALELSTTRGTSRRWTQFIHGNIETGRQWPFNGALQHIEREGLVEVIVHCRGATKDMTGEFMSLESPDQTFGGAPVTLLNVYQMSMTTSASADAADISFDVSTVDCDVKNISSGTTLRQLDLMLVTK